MQHAGKSVFLVAVFACASLASAKPQTQLKIQPGPAVISAEERAIAADPAKGTEHALILVEETDRQEDFIRGHKTAYHLRAKILSNEGRDLANVSIPIYSSDGELTNWWAKTILPDGTVHELRQEQLDRQSTVKTNRDEAREIKGALPGVVPGAIIDYGYVLEESMLMQFQPVNLQRKWAIREFKYRWHPTEGLTSAYRVRHGDGKDVKVTTAPGEILVVAHNLLPVVEEPYMPPDQEVRASVVFYYLDSGADRDYWNIEAKRIERNVKARVGNVERLHEALGVMKLPAEGDLNTQLRAAYNWIAANMKNTWLRSVEEMESLSQEETDGSETWNARKVLEARKGDGRQLDILFIGVARALGAESNLVLVTDRTQGLWDQGLFSTSQFATTVVAVRPPGAPDDKLEMSDPGSGLPYGEVPWWVTGTRGFLATKDGVKAAMLNVTDPSRNTAETEVSLSFSEDNQTMLAHWTTTKTGQQGLGERRELRTLAPSDRTKRLDNLCGAGSRTEVTRAEVPGLEDPTGPYRIECDAEFAETNVDEEISRYLTTAGGPWIVEHLDFSAPQRVHPMIFPYLRTDALHGQLKAPAGFKPMEAPASTELAIPGASYSLTFERTEDGYRFTRKQTWKALMILSGAYDDVRKFLTDIRKADQTQLTFERAAGRP